MQFDPRGGAVVDGVLSGGVQHRLSSFKPVPYQCRVATTASIELAPSCRSG
jgi:hypothetical protein